MPRVENALRSTLCHRLSEGMQVLAEAWRTGLIPDFRGSVKTARRNSLRSQLLDHWSLYVAKL